MKSDTCREKPKGKRDVYVRSDGRQELRSCIRSGISQRQPTEFIRQWCQRSSFLSGSQRSSFGSGVSGVHFSAAANGVHTAVVLYGLAFVSSERAEPHCSEPSAVDLFVLQANRLAH